MLEMQGDDRCKFHQHIQHKKSSVQKTDKLVNDIITAMSRLILQISDRNFDLVFEAYVRMYSEPLLIIFRVFTLC